MIVTNNLTLDLRRAHRRAQQQPNGQSQPLQHSQKKLTRESDDKKGQRTAEQKTN